MANARNRQRRQGRRRPFRDPRQTILVVSDGEITEPEYLRGFASACRNSRVTIQVLHKRGNPRTLIETARCRKEEAEAKADREGDENIAFNSVWCVFDVDENARTAIADAEQAAQDCGISTAVSNPCFELWLLLHFRDNPGMQSHAKAQEMLTKHVSEYDKHVDYATYSAGYEQAVERARRLDRAAEEAHEPGRNPTTGVHKLTELIRDD